MKKWLLVLCTALVPSFAMSANAGSIPPSQMSGVFPPGPPAEPGPPGGAGFPTSGLNNQNAPFVNWVLEQRERRGPVTEVPPSPVPPSAVPLPAAAWLFGSALVALVGVARRKRA